VFALLILWAFESMVDKYGWEMLRSGDYGQYVIGPVTYTSNASNGAGSAAGTYDAEAELRWRIWTRWAAQLSLWIGIVTLSKLILLFCFIIPAKKPLYVAGAWMMSGLVNYPRWELVIVMIIIPFIFNILTFWVSDEFLMNHDDDALSGKAIDDIKPSRQNPSSAATSSAVTTAVSGSVAISVAGGGIGHGTGNSDVNEEKSSLLANDANTSAAH